ncbi:MAG: pyridoxamine 5'-phosphate oxidase family protein [Halobacteriota archaeon]
MANGARNVAPKAPDEKVAKDATASGGTNEGSSMNTVTANAANLVTVEEAAPSAAVGRCATKRSKLAARFFIKITVIKQKLLDLTGDKNGLLKIPHMEKEEYDTLIRENYVSRIAFKGDAYPHVAPFLYIFDGHYLYFLSTR